MTLPPRPKWTALDFPGDFKVGLRGIAELCDWQVRERDGLIQVATSERYRDQAPQLIRLRRLADISNAAELDAYRSLDSWPAQDQFGVTDLVEQIKGLPEVGDPRSARDAWTQFRLLVATLPDREVADYVRRHFLSVVSQIRTASVWAIDVDPRLTWRIATARMLFSAAEAPEVLERAVRDGVRGFPAPMGLMPSFAYGMNALVEPVLLPAAPWILGMNGVRRGGHVLILFGKVEPGFEAVQAPETIDLLHARSMASPRRPVARPEFDPEAAARWLHWWVSRANSLMGLATDIGRYAGPDGIYNSAAQLGVLLSVDRLFATVQEILADAGRSRFPRTLMMFDVIDILDGLSFGSWESMLRIDRLPSQLAELEGLLPAGARDLVLTRCRPAVQALADFTDGFTLIPERLTNDGQIRIRQRDGKGWQDTSLGSAAQSYLRIARNATHSYRQMAKDPRDVSLLGSHLGQIPDHLADLAFFHFLRFLTTPVLPFQ